MGWSQLAYVRYGRTNFDSCNTLTIEQERLWSLKV